MCPYQIYSRETTGLADFMPLGIKERLKPGLQEAHDLGDKEWAEEMQSTKARAQL